jgi:predicted DNA-binding protein with PD1-like motif
MVGVVCAERTRREVTKPTTPADDARPNSVEVPDVVSSSGQFKRVHVFRFKHQADLLAGLEKMVSVMRIRNAAILNGIGSVRNYHIHAVSNRSFPSKNIYIQDTESPADIVSMNGFVLDGRVHAHLTLADEHHAFGGHLEPETNVFTFAVVTVAEFSDEVDLSRFDDKTFR